MAIYTCNICGKPVSDKAAACPHCGAHREEAMPQLVQASNFVEPQPAPQQTEQKPEQPKTHKKTTLIIAILCAVILALVAIIFLVGRNELVFSSQNATIEEAPNKTPCSRQEAYFNKLDSMQPNLKRSPSGYRYEIVRMGSGPNAKVGDMVVFHYRAKTAIDDVPFDQTYGNVEPIKYAIDESILPAFAEALTLGNAGSIVRIYLPAEAVEGDISIPAGDPVIFEIELVELNPIE